MSKHMHARKIPKTRSWLTVATVALSLSAGLYLSRAVSANNVTWDGGGATNNWSEAANWGGDIVPSSGDVAIFDGTSTKNVTIDVNVNVLGIQINTGYTGTIAQAPGAAITIGGSAFNQAAGTFNGSSNTITINSNGAGAFTQSGGIFNGGSGDIRLTGDANANHNFELTGGTFNSTSGTLFLDRSFTHNSGTGTFNHNNGTVTFNGNQNPSFQGSAVGETFNNLNFSKDDGTSVSLFSKVIAVGALALNDGSLFGATVEARAGVTIASTFDGGNATLAIANGGGVTRTFTFAAGANLPNILLNDPDTTINTSGSGTLNWHQLILQQGVINQGAVDFNFFPPAGGGEPFNQSGGTFNGSSHPITFNSNGAGALTQSGGTFNGGSGDLHLIGDANANHNFELTGGTFNSTTGTLFLARGFIHNSGSGTFNHNNGTVTFNSNQNPSIQVSAAGETFNNLNFSKDDGTSLLVLGKVIVVGALALNDGSLSGDGTVEARSGLTVASTFDGGNVTLAIANGGGLTRTITFAAGANLPKILLNDPDTTINTSGAGALNWNQVTLQQGIINQGGVDFNFFPSSGGGEPYTQSGGTFNGSNHPITFKSNGFGAFTQSGGNFNGGSGDIQLIGDANVNHNFLLTGGTFNSTTGTLFLARSFIHNSGSGTFNHNNGTVTFNSNQNPTIQGSAAGETFNNLNFSKGDGSSLSVFNKIIVVGALALNDGSLSGDGQTLELHGNMTIASTFDGVSMAVTFTGSANQIFTNNGAANPTGPWTVNKASGRVTLASNLILNGNQTLDITSGTLDQGASFNLQTSNTLTIGAAGTLRDFGTGDLTLGGSLINNGTFNFNGGGTNCGDPNLADQILIRSSSSGTPRAWSGGGAFSVVDVDVQDQDASAIAAGITAFGSSVVSNSPGWTTNAGCPIAVTTQPTSVSACPGSPASFSVAVSGVGPTFQWRKNGAPLSNGGNISGATTATLTINPVGAADVASAPGYDAIGANSFGVTATTSAATLSLKSAPAITANPSGTIVCAGQSASLSANATGNGISFQWRRNGTPISNGGRISGADTPTLTINPTVAGDDANYDLMVTGDCTPPAISASARLTVNGFALSANSQNFTFAGGGGSVNVITAGACSWIATSNDTFIHITSGSSGTGNGPVTFSVDAGGLRTGTMTIAGQTFTVNQNSPTATTGTIEGRLVDDAGQPVSGVVIRLSGTQTRKTITDVMGAYRFNEVETTGFYIARPARVNYSFNPTERSFSQLGQTTEAQFTAVPNGESANPIDTPEYFVRQQYLDLLGREPDEAGFNYWSDRLIVCGDANCMRGQRVSVAAAFFIEQESQQTGAYIYDIYAGTLNRKPGFAEYSADRQQVVGGASLEAQKTAFAEAFVQRAEFLARYQANTTAESFVDALLQNQQSSGVDLSGERSGLLSAYNAGANPDEGRASVLRAFADNAAFKQTQYNSAFVLTEYFGYLRRDAELDGFNFWLNVLNNSDPQNYRGMVCAFITADEYQRRFGSIVSHNNAECGR